MAAPTFILQGAALSSLGGGDVVWPTGHQADDIGILMIEGANQFHATPSGWTQIGSNVGTGTAGAAGSVGLQAFWKRATSAAEANVVLSDIGDHIRARMLLFRGCETASSPIEGTPTTSTVATPATAVTIAMPTTTVDECYAVALVANATDISNNQTTVGSWVNAALSGFTRIANANSDVGVGGGIDGGGGTKAVAGAISNTTTTLNTASAQATIAFALKPPQVEEEPPVANGGIYVATGIKATAGALSGTTATMDNAGIQARLTFALKPPAAPPVDLPPIVDQIPAIVGAVDASVQFPIVASDPEGLDLNLTLVAGDSAVPSGAEVIEDDLSGLYSFQWTPTTLQAGEWHFAVEVSDGVNTVTRNIDIVVQGTPDTTFFELANELADRANVDIESARALSDILVEQDQLNANVMTKVQELVADLEASRDYFLSIIADLESEDPV